MTRWCLAAMMVLALPLAAEDARRPGPKEVFHDASPDGRPWRDEESGFGLPQRLGSFTMLGWSEYADSSLGVRVRMFDNESQARVDIYVYPCGLPIITDADKQKAVETELANSLNSTLDMEKRGMFSDVKHQDATSDPVKLLPTGSVPMVGAGVTMKIHQKTITGDDAVPVISWHGVALFGTKYVKLRYTFPASKSQEGEKLLNDFISLWKYCLREPSFRDFIKPQAKTYLADPLSKKAEEAGAAVLLYAEHSPFINLSISPRLSQLLEVAGKASKGSELDLMRAFIVGSIEASLRTGEANETEAGAAKLVEVYHLLQKQHPELQVEAMGELEEAVKRKGAKAWLEAVKREE